MYAQTLPANPNIPCKPGWCLAYVNEVFGVPKRFGSATAAWEASATKHKDRNFPSNVWLPVWYGLANEPAGHVVLLAPDGSVFSTSDLGNVPHHHPDLADLEAYYAYYGMPLTYRGWTEDVEGTRVITPDAGSAAISLQDSTVTPIPKEWDEMASKQDFMDAINAELQSPRSQQLIKDAVYGELGAVRTTKRLQGAVWTQVGGERSGKLVSMWRDMVDTNTIIRLVLAAVQDLSKKSGTNVSALNADAVVDALADRLNKSASPGQPQ